MMNKGTEMSNEFEKITSLSKLGDGTSLKTQN